MEKEVYNNMSLKKSIDVLAGAVKTTLSTKGRNVSGVVATGVAILRRALEEPLRTLAQNGGQDGAVVVEAVRRKQAETKNQKLGYNVLDEQYEDMVEADIIDPAKVTRSVIQNAASIAAMILTTEALITDLPEKEHVSAPAI